MTIDSQANKPFTATPFVWKDPAKLEPIRMTADEPMLEDIDPKILEWVRQGFAARELVEAEASKAPDNDNEAGAKGAKRPFAFTPYVPQDPKTLPRREFLHGTHYIRKYVSVTVSPGGLGKTSNSIVEALAMVSGKALLSPDGGGISGRLRVALYNGEDPRDEMERRIEAARLYYKLTAGDLAGLFLDVGREQELVVVSEDKRSGIKINAPVVEAVVEHIMANQIDVMILDPFVSTHAVNENDNGAIDKVAKLWGQIADRTNSSIELVHHLRKLNDKEATIDDARGAVALIGAARSVRLLNRMSRDDASAAGVPPQDVPGRFYIISGKSNMTKQDDRRDWRQLESVGLGNGAGLTKPQDRVGVVTSWVFPSREEIAASAASEVTAEQVEMILVRLENQTWKSGRTSGERWAGNLIMDVLGLDSSEKDNRALADRILAGWRADGTVAVVEEQNPANRHKWHVLRPTRPQPEWRAPTSALTTALT